MRINITKRVPCGIKRKSGLTLEYWVPCHWIQPHSVVIPPSVTSSRSVRSPWWRLAPAWYPPQSARWFLSSIPDSLRSPSRAGWSPGAACSSSQSTSLATAACMWSPSKSLSGRASPPFHILTRSFTLFFVQTLCRASGASRDTSWTSPPYWWVTSFPNKVSWLPHKVN